MHASRSLTRTREDGPIFYFARAVYTASNALLASGTRSSDGDRRDGQPPTRSYGQHDISRHKRHFARETRITRLR
ncbi:hypothetical protein VTO73DRAFT_343 [Trametes versicolor]